MRRERNGIDSSTKLCVDASVVVRLLNGTLQPETAERWDGARQAGRSLIAPTLIGYEVANSLYQSHRAARTPVSALLLSMNAFSALRIQLIGDDLLHGAALTIAANFDLPASYDAHYLAAAERFQIELWTADRRLFNSVAKRLPWVVLTE